MDDTQIIAIFVIIDDVLTHYGHQQHRLARASDAEVLTVAVVAAQDLTPVHELLWELPRGGWVLGDKGYISAADAQTIWDETGVRLVAMVRANMTPNRWEERQALEQYRHTIETVNSQLERMGFERLYARTNAGFEIKAHASLLAVACHNIH